MRCAIDFQAHEEIQGGLGQKYLYVDDEAKGAVFLQMSWTVFEHTVIIGKKPWGKASLLLGGRLFFLKKICKSCVHIN